MIPTCVLTLSILAALLHGVTTLRLVDLKVPPYIIKGQPVRLECHYDLEGEALYSVKWFKDDQEFFRYQPEDEPPAHVFKRKGVLVDYPNSSDTAVMLLGVTEDSGGNYRCEVSGEAPSFKTVSDVKNLVVVELPDASGPELEGLRARYQLGELLSLNCTSSRSRPAAELSWFVNYEPAEETWLRFYPLNVDEDGKQSSSLGLEFRIRRKHLEKGELKVKCLATIDTLYWRANEQSVDVDRPHNSAVLESRGGAFPGAASSIKNKAPLTVLLGGMLSLFIMLTTQHFFNFPQSGHPSIISLPRTNDGLAR